MSQSIVVGAASAPELQTLPSEEFVELKPVREFEVWARIKKSSKYYNQGLRDCNKLKAGVRMFKVRSFDQSFHGDKLDKEKYSLHFNGNHYRLADVEIFLVDPTQPDRRLRIL